MPKPHLSETAGITGLSFLMVNDATIASDGWSPAASSGQERARGLTSVQRLRPGSAGLTPLPATVSRR